MVFDQGLQLIHDSFVLRSDFEPNFQSPVGVTELYPIFHHQPLGAGTID